MRRQLNSKKDVFWRTGKNRYILLLAILGFVIVTIVFFHNLRTQQLNEHLKMVQKIDQAEVDFSNGLMHVSLSQTQKNIDTQTLVNQSRQELTPWQYNVGIALLRQALADFEELASQLPTIDNNISFIEAIGQLSNTLNQISKDGSLNDANLRQDVFMMRKQVAIAEKQLSQQLEKQRLKQGYWASAAVILCTLVLTFLLFALRRSEQSRTALDNDLQLSEQRFFKLLQNTKEIFWLESYPDHRLVYVSPLFEKLTHIRFESVLNKTNAWKELLQTSDYELIERARVRAMVEPQDIEFQYTPSHGPKVWITGRVFPIWSTDEHLENEKPEYMGVLLRDITQKKEYEQSLFQSQKMESLGQLTGGVAHDFNNLLTVILSNAQMLAGNLDEQPKLAATAKLICRAAKRGASLNQQLLAFASKQQLHPELVPVNELVNDAISLLSNTLGKKYRFALAQSPQSLCVKVDPGQFQNALVNLCINSRDAMPDGGKISIRTGVDQVIDENGYEINMVNISVKDDGCGIPAELLNRVFDPFFSTKAKDKGSGLGLSMVFGFVRQSGGTITVNSKPDKGTTIHIRLPQHVPKGYKAIEDSPTAVAAEETLLLVEDDDLVRESASATLRNAGYHVYEATCTEDAKFILAHKNHIDLVITDVVMPGEEDGFALAKHIEAKYDKIAIMVISGYIGDDRAHLPQFKFLQKPFSNHQLITEVAKLIELKKEKTVA